MKALSAAQDALIKMMHDGGRVYYMSGRDSYCYISYKGHTKCSATVATLERKGVLKRMQRGITGNCEFELTEEWKKK